MAVPKSPPGRPLVEERDPQRALEESEERFRSLLEAAPEWSHEQLVDLVRKLVAGHERAS